MLIKFSTKLIIFLLHFFLISSNTNAQEFNFEGDWQIRITQETGGKRNQDGFLKNRENYEIINPEDVGLKASSIDLTARSGRAALKHRLKLLGFSFSKVELETIYIKFIEMADEKKLLHDEDLYELMKKYN